MEKVTLKHLAERAHTSMNTVSKVLRGDDKSISKKKREEIISLAAELGYIPNSAARFLRKQKTNLVGLIVGDNTNPYFATTIKVVQSELKEKGFYVLAFNNYENVDDEMGIISEFCGLNVAGVLLTPALSNSHSAEMLRNHHIPYVLMSRLYDKDKDNYVLADDEYAGYMAAKHLLLNYPGPMLIINYIKDITTTRFRQLGFERALNEFKIIQDPSLIIYDCMGHDQSYAAMKEYLKTNPPPRSVVCYSDYLAMGVLTAIQEQGLKTPDDVAVMGIDNTDELLNNGYGLSTVSLPVKDISIKSVELLLELIKKRNENVQQPERQIILPPSLALRTTA